MSEDGFCVITRRKWVARRSLLKSRGSCISDKSNDESPSVDVQKFQKRLDNVCADMMDSEYFTTAMSTLTKCLTELSMKVQDIMRIVCFGIGPFTRTYQALHQLAFILSTRQYCEISEAIFFDPAFDDAEKEVLHKRQCSVMSENCEAKYSTDVLTLFYMPHCPNELTNNLLWRNWRPEMLGKMLLISNSFNSLSSSKPQRLLRLELDHMLDVLPHTKEFSLKDDYKTPNVFNDLSMHIFPTHNLPENDSKFWAQRAEPTYTEDNELISAEQFANLSIR